MDLFPFQVQASTQIADRYQNYMQDPIPTRGKRIIPFYQNLSAITGSGKTLILADAIEQIRSRLPVEPIVLWLSKGKVVVWQTYTNLSTGKYAELLGGFDVKPLLDCKQVDVENSDRGLVLVTTVAKFNQKEKDPGNRKIFRLDRDAADQSLWEMLKSRKNSKGIRRPLIVVYDEGHNLTSQQTELLFELHPEGLIAASATMKVPEALSKIITRLKEDADWTDADMVTSVQSTKVVESGLVKKQIMLGGYVTPMEIAINDMIEDMRGAEKAALTLGGSFAPKAIYVSTTNAVDGATIAEESTRLFKERMARPILIWRHLVESCGVDPKTIAVYCDLKFDAKAGPPINFNLFSGGDSDYDRFIAGGFRHIIFNLSLQEGWDDPECCFAYIDKDMGSPDQVTQVIGRVLRQPGAQHYSASVLNTAHFYIRTDEKRVFESIIDDVRKKLVSDSPDTTLSIRRVSKAGDRPINKVLKNREVPTVSIYSGAAVEPIREIVRKIINFSGNTEDTVGKGSRIQVLQTIGTGEDVQEEWVDVEHSNTVNARWVFLRELQKLHPKAARLCDIEHPKFDALIEYNSAAADHIREQALKVVEAYIEHSVIVQNSLDHPYVVDDMPYDDSKLVKYTHALHEGYSGLNGLEKEIADAIDKTKRVWCRNPSTGGFGIPLLDRGSTKTFHPDFLVWTDKHIIAIETKGDHLIVEDATRKLFHIEQIENGPELVIRFITEGKWDVGRGTQFIKESPDGFTVWTIKHGKFHPTHLKDASAAVQACINVELASGKSS